jgi:hypothetical protein
VTQDYLSSVFQWWPVSSIVFDALLIYADIQLQSECTFWIRCSSGRLCVDLVSANFVYFRNSNGVQISALPGIKPSEAQAQEASAIDSLTLEQYHRICYWNLSQPRNLCCSASATLNVDTIIARISGDRLEDMVEIALLPDAEVDLGRWGIPSSVTWKVVENGWTRYYDFILAVW